MLEYLDRAPPASVEQDRLFGDVQNQRKAPEDLHFAFEQDAEVAAQGIAFEYQGDPAMYSQAAVNQRQQLRKSPQIMHSIDE